MIIDTPTFEKIIEIKLQTHFLSICRSFVISEITYQYNVEGFLRNDYPVSMQDYAI